MGHSNSTTNYSLPQFLSTDKPAWLTDINSAFSAIDTAVKNAQDAGDNAQGDATQALTDAGNALTAANTADGKGTGAVSSIAPTFDPTSTYVVGALVMYNNLLYICTAAVETPGAWTGSANWARENVSGINTTIKSEISAINTELSGKVDTSDFSAFTNLFKNTVITNQLNVSNTNGFDITLPYVATNDRYANCIIINPHNTTVAVVTLRPNSVSHNLLGSNNWTATTSDNQTFTVKPASQSWGLSTIIINYAGV